MSEFMKLTNNLHGGFGQLSNPALNFRSSSTCCSSSQIRLQNGCTYPIDATRLSVIPRDIAKIQASKLERQQVPAPTKPLNHSVTVCNEHWEVKLFANHSMLENARLLANVLIKSEEGLLTLAEFTQKFDEQNKGVFHQTTIHQAKMRRIKSYLEQTSAKYFQPVTTPNEPDLRYTFRFNVEDVQIVRSPPDYIDRIKALMEASPSEMIGPIEVLTETSPAEMYEEYVNPKPWHFSSPDMTPYNFMPSNCFHCYPELYRAPLPSYNSPFFRMAPESSQPQFPMSFQSYWEYPSAAAEHNAEPQIRLQNNCVFRVRVAPSSHTKLQYDFVHTIDEEPLHPYSPIEFQDGSELLVENVQAFRSDTRQAAEPEPKRLKHSHQLTKSKRNELCYTAVVYNNDWEVHLYSQYNRFFSHKLITEALISTPNGEMTIKEMFNYYQTREPKVFKDGTTEKDAKRQLRKAAELGCEKYFKLTIILKNGKNHRHVSLIHNNDYVTTIKSPIVPASSKPRDNEAVSDGTWEVKLLDNYPALKCAKLIAKVSITSKTGILTIDELVREFEKQNSDVFYKSTVQWVRINQV